MLLLLPLVSLAGDAPLFTSSSVLPAKAGRLEPLRRMMLVSIYGSHLGPDTACTAPRGMERPELCGVTVTVGGKSAGLLYVQDRQINLSVPATAPAEGAVDFIVTYNGLSSTPVPVRFAPLDARMKVTGPAYVNMPIWVEVDLPEPYRQPYLYPVRIYPVDFGGHRLEVRRNGAALTPIKPAHQYPMIGSGPFAPGAIGGGGFLGLPHAPRNCSRLPLHLAYRFDRPGLYEVRYQGVDLDGQPLVRSGWVSFEVHDYSPAQRAAWLAAMRQAAPSDPVELLSDYLPSLVAVPDKAVLAMLDDYFYNSNDLVRQYTMYALYLFDDALAVKEIPDLVERRGPTDELAYLLSWRRDVFQPQGAALARAAIRYLDSPDPLLEAGALKTLEFLKLHYDWRAGPATPALIDREISSRASRFIDTRNDAIIRQLALNLGSWKTDQSRALLWRIVEEQPAAREQALICLTWIGDPRDLPKLAGYNTGSLDYSLNRAYGAAAAPYLKNHP